MTKHIRIRLLISAVIISLGWVVVSYYIVSSRVSTLTNEKYIEASKEMKDFLEIFVSEKQEALSLISFALAHDSQVKKALLEHNPDLLKLEDFSLQLKKHTLLQNVWLQVIEPDGKSFYRSWSSKRGDDLSAVRLDIANIIKEPRVTNSISVGKFDLTFKSTVPIYHDNTFIGLVETVAKFNSITLKMKKKGFDVVTLVDKSYKSQLQFPFTKTFIHDYYVADLNANKELMSFIEERGVDYFIDGKDYYLAADIHRLIAVFHLNDINNHPMSYFLLFHDLSDIDLSSIERIRDRLILASVLGLMLLISGLYYLYVKSYKRFIDNLNKQLKEDIASKTIELEEQNKKLNHIAYHDVLTQLPNRLLFLDRLEQSLKLAKRHSTHVSLLFLDLDRFKEINDTYGHEAGDRLLQETTKRLQQCVREYDTIARLGGDEFTIIIEGSENKKIVDIIQDIIDKIKDPVFVNGNTLHTTFSIGISSYPEDGDTSDILLRNADTAMYKAKERGRNTYEFYNATMTQQAFKRVALETDLRQAIEDGDFQAYYQPKANSLTGKVTGMEALVRWNHKTLGMIPPDEFIPLAEEIGLIAKIDNWMMEETMKTALAWQKEGLYIGKLSLNVSMKQLEDKNFVSHIKEIILRTAFNPEFLELEITESQIMKNPKSTIDILNSIRSLGITISIDDFGTGYSSLSYLKRLPINKLKIDKSFIQDIPQNEDDKVIVKAIIVLAQSLKLNIIAEGVETVEQKDFLIGVGCPNIQGYYYSKPLPADAYRDFLIKHS